MSVRDEAARIAENWGEAPLTHLAASTRYPDHWIDQKYVGGRRNGLHGYKLGRGSHISKPVNAPGI